MGRDLLLPLAAAAFVIIITSIMISSLRSSPNVFFSKTKAISNDTTTILVGNEKIKVELAETASEHQIGLSGRKKIDYDEGMLFIFPQQDVIPTFWMKDMLFPIDIIWINNGEIIQIHQNVANPEPDTPISDLVLYKPYVPIDYVLEVKGGFVEKNDIAVRDKVDLSNVE